MVIHLPAMAGLFRVGEFLSRVAANSSSARARSRRWRRRGGFHWRRLLHFAKYFRKR
jgi:hypothetical protein